MKNWYSNKKNFCRIALIVIFILALFLRTYRLSSVPPGFTDDELRDAFIAYSVGKTGQGLESPGMFPFIFIVDSYSFTPVPIYILAPIVGTFGISPITVRLPYVVVGLLSLLGTYVLAKRLIGHTGIALLGAFCMSVNAWAIQLSRLSYDSEFAMMFYLWGTIVFLSDWKKHVIRSVVVAMALYFLAFNCYDAMKLIYIPVLLAVCWYKWKKLVGRKDAVIAILLSVVITWSIFYYFYGIQHPGVRGGNISIFQNIEAAAQSVELSRRGSTAPEFLKVIYHNKVTYFADMISRHFLYPFSSDYLFFDQEASGIFSLWLRGNFYLIELPLMALGGLYIFLKRRKAFWLTIVMLLSAAIPAGLGPSPYTYAIRASFMLPWFVVVIGAGIVYLIELGRVKIVKIGVVVTLIVCYVYCIGGYFNQYFFEWPKNNAKYFSKGIMDVAKYVKENKATYPSVFISNTNSTFFLYYALENNIDIRRLQAYYRSGDFFNFENIRILPSCLETPYQDPRMSIDPGTMYVTSPYCHKSEPDQKITLPTGEEQWYIYLRPKVL
jgi:hypothetical protein